MQPLTKFTTKTGLPIALAVSVLAIIGVVAVMGSAAPPNPATSSGQQSTLASDSTPTPPQCSAPCAVWKDAGGSNPEVVAIAPNDAFVVVGNGTGIYEFDGQGGHLLWRQALNHTISSLSISSNGELIAASGWQILGGCPPSQNATGFRSCPAAVYANGEVYLLSSSNGKLLWSKSTGSGNPVFKVILSGDGSKLAVDTEGSIMFLGAQAGDMIWSYNTGSGDIAGLGMSADGSLVVASMGLTITAFNDQGRMVWSHPGMELAVSVDSVAVSSDGSYAWVGSAVSGSNGSLYLFGKQGTLLWQRQIYSPVLSLQTGGNETAFVSTNWGALLYGADGSLLENVTGSSPAIHNDCTYLPVFWYSGGNQAPLTFFDSQGNAISSYSPAGFTVNGALSADGHYAAIVSQQGVGLGSGYSLTFVYLGQPSQSCIHD